MRAFDLPKENDSIGHNKDEMMGGTLRSPTFQNLFLDTAV